MSEIVVKNLSKTFGQTASKVDALKDINLTIETGDIYGIIGMSGAGKSTLVRCFNFLEKPTSGEVWIGGKNLGSLSEQELRKASGADVEELDEADMDRAAGGGCWNGEDAPDGHEMGCHIFYHDNDYSQKTGNFCKQVYFVKGCRSFGCVETSDL